MTGGEPGGTRGRSADARPRPAAPARRATRSAGLRLTRWAAALGGAATALALGGAGSTVAAPAAPGLACPAALDGRPLDGAALFDGPPSEGAELAPESSSRARNLWSGLATATGPLVLVCRFRGRAEPLEMRLPAGVSSCRGELAPGGRGYRSFACRA